MRYRILTAMAVAGVTAFTVVGVEGATPAQFGGKCAAAWTGAKSGAAYNAYKSKCVTAATSAASNATDAGNPTNAKANGKRANAACGAQFKPPRNTAAKQKAFAACVKAAVAAQVAFAGRPLTATLKGANEVPAAGPGAGTASIRLNQGRKRVCYTITASGLEGSPVNAAHIHQGAAGVSGPPVIALPNIGPLNSGQAARGCVEGVSASLIKQIRQTPGNFYVNVHTDAFGGGAARGQLGK